MDSISRRYYEPVDNIPHIRSSIRDRHHLFWTGADLRRHGLGVFRGLDCASAGQLDSMVHSLVHQRFSGVLTLSGDNLADFRTRANRCIERHQLKTCACWSAARLCTVDTLSLTACNPRLYEGTPCSAVLVDGQVYELMRDFYAAVAPITEAVRDQLADRCDKGECACMVRRGSQLIRQPDIWGQFRLKAV
jgi:hypothetical protein